MKPNNKNNISCRLDAFREQFLKFSENSKSLSSIIQPTNETGDFDFILESKKEIDSLVLSRSVEFAKFAQVKNELQALLCTSEKELESYKQIPKLSFDNFKLIEIDDLNYHINDHYVLSELSQLLDEGSSVKCDRVVVNTFLKNIISNKIKSKATEYKHKIYEYLLPIMATSGTASVSAMSLVSKELERLCSSGAVPNITAHLVIQLIKEDVELYNQATSNIELLPIHPITNIQNPDYEGYIARIIFCTTVEDRKKYEYLVNNTILLEELFKYARYLNIPPQEIADRYTALKKRYTLNTNPAVKDKFIFNKLFTVDNSESTFADFTSYNLSHKAYSKAYGVIRDSSKSFYEVKTAMNIISDLLKYDFTPAKTLFRRHQGILDKRLIMSLKQNIIITKNRELPRSKRPLKTHSSELLARSPAE